MLNDTKIKSLKPKEKAYKISDNDGLYIYVSTTGKKVFRIDYTFQGKRKTYTLKGEYPLTTLLEARKELNNIRTMLKEGVDPQAEKQAIIQAEQDLLNNTFSVVALEWYQLKKHELRESTLKKIIQNLNNNILPFLGKHPIEEIKAKDMLEVLKRLEERNLLDTLDHAKRICSQIFRYGIATSRCEYDITAGLRGAFKKPKNKNYSALTDPKLIGQLLRDIDKYYIDNKRVGLVTILAIKFAMYTLCRSQEVCFAEWKEIDFEKALWTIPADKMKMDKEHLVPLSKQALTILEELKLFTGDKDFIFHSSLSKLGHIRGESLSKALRDNLGYRDKHTIHGFRSMGSTLLNEKGYRHDIIEKSLAHSGEDKIRAIYNRAEYLAERKKMMQDYADMLDELKAVEDKRK